MGHRIVGVFPNQSFLILFFPSIMGISMGQKRTNLIWDAVILRWVPNSGAAQNKCYKPSVEAFALLQPHHSCSYLYFWNLQVSASKSAWQPVTNLASARSWPVDPNDPPFSTLLGKVPGHSAKETWCAMVNFPLEKKTNKGWSWANPTHYA